MKKFTQSVQALHEAEAAGLSELQKSYQDYFLAKLNKYGVKSPAELSTEKKSEFFNEISKDWDRGQGATKAGLADVEKHGVKESEEVNEAKNPNKVSISGGEYVGSHGIKIDDNEKEILVDLGKDGKKWISKKYVEKVDESNEVNEAKELTPAKLVSKIVSSNKQFKWLEQDLPKNCTIEDVKNIMDKYGYSSVYDKFANESLEVNEKLIKEEDVKSESDFKEYARGVLKKAHKDEYDEKKADQTIEGILKKADGDYGKAVGILNSSLA